MRLSPALLSIQLIVVGVGLPQGVIAKQSAACVFVEKQALKKALKSIGGIVPR